MITEAEIMRMDIGEVTTRIPAAWEELKRLNRDASRNGRSESLDKQIRDTHDEWNWLMMRKAVLEDSMDLSRRYANTIRSEANIGIRFEGRTFDNFERDLAPNAYDVCMSYSNSDHYRYGAGLILFGRPGVGKTHLAAAISNRFVERGVPVLFNTYVGHLNHLKAEMNHGDRKYLKQMETVGLLVLDDVGKEQPTSWAAVTMYTAINSRYEKNLPIIITTNLPADGFERYMDSAVYSRICEMCRSLTIQAEDYRRRKWKSR